MMQIEELMMSSTISTVIQVIQKDKLLFERHAMRQATLNLSFMKLMIGLGQAVHKIMVGLMSPLLKNPS
jgi:hypothetical protein